MAVPEPSSADDGEGEDRQRILCVYCRQPQTVSVRAISVTCKHCNKAVTVESLVIHQNQARRTIETCGSLTVEKTGNLFSARVMCSALIVRGKIRSDILCHGPVLVGPEAQVRGNVRARTLAVGEGAVLEGHYQIGLAGG